VPGDCISRAVDWSQPTPAAVLPFSPAAAAVPFCFTRIVISGGRSGTEKKL
jgi:hypothetical protein